MQTTAISESEYEKACEENLGFCTNCQQFTNSGCEPDARNYECEECGRRTVFGAEEALIMGLLEFSEEDE